MSGRKRLDPILKMTLAVHVTFFFTTATTLAQHAPFCPVSILFRYQYTLFHEANIRNVIKISTVSTPDYRPDAFR